MFRRPFFLFTAIVCLSLGGAAAADDIAEAIADAQKAYKSGDLAAAKQSLDLASPLIFQKNAEGDGSGVSPATQRSGGGRRGHVNEYFRGDHGVNGLAAQE